MTSFGKGSKLRFMAYLHTWQCQHPGCEAEQYSALGPASLVLHVRGHNKAFHPNDPEIDTWTLTQHPGYRAPAGSVAYARPDHTPVIDQRSRLEPYGFCNKLTDWDIKFLREARVKW